ncbi:hypothetical protein FOL47_004286 [Perkinsus chesapeaki]|uniref:Uncharacterized protein n=1 Tax=Perkinsus chesapeaki TaxID=330153 RepID=A0A7J6M3I5_PERCH|nr:hypothetical protein FOL47_004286 [Perkinsus chesapeaki]
MAFRINRRAQSHYTAAQKSSRQRLLLVDDDYLLGDIFGVAYLSLLTMLNFCSGCFDRSPNAVPPRASEMITPMPPRRVEVTREKGKFGDEENVPIKAMLPPPPIANQYEKVSLKAFREAKLGKGSTPAAVDATKGAGLSSTAPPASPLAQEGCASDRSFPYMHCHDNSIANVSDATFPYMTAPPCVGLVTASSFPYVYNKYNDAKGVAIRGFPYMFDSVNHSAVVCGSSFPYLYKAEGLETVKVDTASYPYVYDDDTPRPISEAQRNRNRRSFRSFIRGQQ